MSKATKTKKEEAPVNEKIECSKKTSETTVTAIEIAERAYFIWESNGCCHGKDVEDWLKAEQELQEKRSS